MHFIKHQKAIEHSENSLKAVRKQIDEALELNTFYSPNEYQFLIDIAGLIVAARRSLSYTYAVRFFLKGE